jgi:Tetratricopeptide repeat.
VSGEKFGRIANYHKELGNEYFLRGDIKNAIQEFSKAIVIKKMFA